MVEGSALEYIVRTVISHVHFGTGTGKKRESDGSFVGKKASSD